jgi:Fur family zinc uptake transcriptional regulator
VTESKVLRKFTRRNHSHAACVSRALETAKQTCKLHGNRLTPIRESVLELVWKNHEPVKAYDILQQLQEKRVDKTAAPPTVYRALNFLMEEGLIHKIESLNAFVGCGKPGHTDAGQFFICNSCGEIAELYDPELTSLISRNANNMGFQIKNQVVEINGLCSHCQR